MQSGLVIVWVWAIGALLVGLVAAAVGVCFMIKAHKYSVMQEKIVKLVEKRTREKYNAIATLPPKEFGDFLSTMFAKMLEVKSASQVSDADPKADELLYTEATGALIDFLGPETVAAIDYYYGNNYIYRWTKSSYALLHKRGITPKIIAKEIQYETAAKNMI